MKETKKTQKKKLAIQITKKKKKISTRVAGTCQVREK